MQVELLNVYDLMLKRFGKQYWWPAKTRFEVIVGAILTQNTAWHNVEVAIKNLERKGILNPDGISNAGEDVLYECIKPAGYFKVKTKRLKNFIEFLFREYNGDLDALLSLDKEELRRQLLNVNGIGRETADSIILYAGDKPSFVIDAYTKRIFRRIGAIKGNPGYDEIKKYFEENLPKDIEIYNEFHALIVKLGKEYCKVKPVCDGCPLKGICDYKS